MGSGPPAGWCVDGQNYEWVAEKAEGPLGVGAARIRFGDGGRVVLSSPARPMRSGVRHAAGVWLRSDPAGATVQLTVYDNVPGRPAAFDETFTTAHSWGFVKVQKDLPKAVRDHYYMTLTAHGDKCTLWLDGLLLGECEAGADAGWRPPAHPAGVALESEAAWGLVTGGAPHRVKARVVGVTGKDCRLQLRAVHTNGMKAELPPVPLDDAGVWEGSFEVTGEIAEAFGMLRIEATVAAADGRPLSAMAETLLARAPEPVPGPLPVSPFGIHVALREPDLEAVAKLGYKWCRIHDANGSTKWGYAEPEPGKWVWFDDEIALARKHGFCILGLLDGSPAWESGTQEKGYWRIYGAPKDVDNWRNYVREVVGHYAGSIEEWEVWNEPWDMNRFFKGGTPMLYAKLLKAAYEEAKAVNPQCTIVGVDTYPPFWEAAVLALGALPYYDVMSWHRYDPSLHGRPNDSIARVAERLRVAQARHGTPKPVLCSEGGPDVSIFHGSFFSFADPEVMGDWSEGADRYSRMYLSAIAAGNRRLIAYSVHNAPRHGLQTHMLIEPGPLLRPMHLALAALAHFVEGARYEKRLVPAHDISAHVFSQPSSRPYSDEPSTVVALIADGPELEPLPKPLPRTVRCFDRWGNPAPIPTQATRGITYLVATGDARGELLAALEGDPSLVERGPDIEALLKATVTSLTQGDPPLWKLLSAQGALVITATPDGPLAVRRTDLRSDEQLAGKLRLPAGAEFTGQTVTPAGQFKVGSFELAANAQKWSAAFAATRDGPGGSWRYTMLTVVPAGREPETSEREEVLEPAKLWESALLVGHTRDLHDTFYDGPCCVAANTLNGEYLLFDDPECLISMLDTAVMFGPAATSVMMFSKVEVSGDVAMILGNWNIVSLTFGAAPYAIMATLISTEDGWKIASMCTGSGY